MKENKLATTLLTFVFLAFLSFHFFVLQVSLDLSIASVFGVGFGMGGDVLMMAYFIIMVPMFLFILYQGYYVLRLWEEKFAAGVNSFAKNLFFFAIPILAYFIYKNEFKILYEYIYEYKGISINWLVVIVSLIVRWGMERIFLKHTKKQNK